MATTTTEAPRVYVACLAAYNAGKLHGEWIDMGDADDAHEQALQVLETSPEAGAEEWAILVALHGPGTFAPWAGRTVRAAGAGYRPY